MRDALKRAAEASAELVALLAEAAAAYVKADPRAHPPEGGARAEAWEWVERIAEAWRDAEQKGATLRELVDEAGTAGPFGLLGAIQDSLVLSLSPDAGLRGAALSAQEVGERVEQLREGGAFDGPVGPPLPKTPSGEVSEDDGRRFEDLSSLVLASHGDNLELYARLKPDGRELDMADAGAVRDRVQDTAGAARALDAERELVEGLRGRRDLRSDLEMLRATQEGFVLALADDPARRAKAIPAEELRSLWAPLHERWKAELPNN